MLFVLNITSYDMSFKGWSWWDHPWRLCNRCSCIQSRRFVFINLSNLYACKPDRTICDGVTGEFVTESWRAKWLRRRVIEKNECDPWGLGTINKVAFGIRGHIWIDREEIGSMEAVLQPISHSMARIEAQFFSEGSRHNEVRSSSDRPNQVPHSSSKMVWNHNTLGYRKI